MKTRILAIAAATSALLLTGCATDSYYGGYNGNNGYNNSYNTPYNQPNYQRNYGNYNTPYNGYNNGYNGNYNGNYSNARTGVIYSVQPVTIAGQTSGAGIGIGAVAGGLIGNQIGHGSGRAVATLLGAVGGGALGNQVEKNGYGQRPGVELQVRVDQTGEMIRIVQPDNGQGFSSGSRVRLVYEGNTWRAMY